MKGSSVLYLIHERERRNSHIPQVIMELVPLGFRKGIRDWPDVFQPVGISMLS